MIVGLQQTDLAIRQLQVLQNAGLKTQVYIWPENKVITPYLPECVAIMQSFGIKRIWVDVEDSSNNIDAALSWLLNEPKVKAGIYTSAYMWSRYMLNTTRFGHLPLWYAHYDYTPDMADFVPFGGWEQPCAKQYGGNNSRYDLDVYVKELM